MAQVQSLALDYDPDKFPLGAYLYRSDLGLLFFNSGTYDAPNFTNMGSGVTMHQFTTTEEAWTAITGLTSATITLVGVDMSNATKGQIDVLIDGTIVDSVLAGSVQNSKAYKPSSSVSFKTTAKNDSALFPTTEDKAGDFRVQEVNGEVFWVDGAHAYVLGTLDDVFEYSLSTVDDPTGMSYTSRLFSLGAEITGSARSLTLNPAGTKMFIYDGVEMHEYALSTAWEIDSASFTDADNPGGSGNTVSATWRTNGTAWWYTDSINDTIRKQTCSAWDVSTSVASGGSVDLSVDAPNLRKFSWNSDGTIFYFANDSTLKHYVCSTPWDLFSKGSVQTGTTLDHMDACIQLNKNNDRYLYTIEAGVEDDLIRYDAVFAGTAEIHTQ